MRHVKHCGAKRAWLAIGITALIMNTTQLMSQPTCQGYPGGWERKLTYTDYSWRLNLSQVVRVVRTDGTVIPEDEIREDIRYAIAQWLAAVNSVTTVLRFQEEGGGPRVLDVWFQDLINGQPGICGMANFNSENPIIYLKSSGWYSASASGVHLRTTILHEMGHIFLGSGHWTSGQGSGGIMTLRECDERRREQLSECEVYLTFNFYNQPVSVELDQQRQSGERLSNTRVGRWNSSYLYFEPITIPPPEQPLPRINTVVGAREVLQGRQDTVVRNAVEKYRVWRRNSTDQLDSVQNHRGFTIRADDANLTSRFHSTDPTIAIKTDLLDAPGTTGGNIQFRDPWYIDFQDTLYGNNVAFEVLNTTGVCCAFAFWNST